MWQQKLVVIVLVFEIICEVMGETRIVKLP